MNETNTQQPNDASLPPLQEAMQQFKAQRVERRELAEKLLPILEKNRSIQQVEEILGLPDNMVWNYTLFYSSTLVIYFDIEGKVKNIASDLLDEIEPEAALETEYTDIISAFKEQPYNRRDPAKKLLPLIKTGMLTQEVETILGSPDEKRWEYSLVHTLTSSLIVSFSIEDKLEEVTITLLE